MRQRPKPTSRREHSLYHPPERTSISNLRRVGRELDCTHRQLATLLGVSLATLEHWLSGRTQVPRPMTLALAYLQRRRVQRKSVQKRRKREKLLKQSLELRPPVKHKFY